MVALATAKVGLGPPGMDELTPARQALVEKWRWLAFKLAVRSKAHGLDRDQRESAALWGLCLAARDFEEGRGAQFATYATAVIRRWLERSAQLEAWPIRIPLYLQWAGADRRKTRHAEECRAAADRVRHALALLSDYTRDSADESPAAIAEANDQQYALRAAIDRLPAPQREVILDRLAGLTFRQSGRKRGTSAEWARTQAARAIESLRASMAI